MLWIDSISPLLYICFFFVAFAGCLYFIHAQNTLRSLWDFKSFYSASAFIFRSSYTLSGLTDISTKAKACNILNPFKEFNGKMNCFFVTCIKKNNLMSSLPHKIFCKWFSKVYQIQFSLFSHAIKSNLNVVYVIINSWVM